MTIGIIALAVVGVIVMAFNPWSFPMDKNNPLTNEKYDKLLKTLLKIGIIIGIILSLFIVWL
jgi:hypothetical protein